MGDLSKHFSHYEFACRCGCDFKYPKPLLIQELEIIRELLGGHTITIASGCRCNKYNLQVGGKPNSKHKKGQAADFIVGTVGDDGITYFKSPDTVHEALSIMYAGKYGLGEYSDFTHLDTREGMARW